MDERRPKDGQVNFAITIAHLWNGKPAKAGETVDLMVSTDGSSHLLVSIDAPFHNDPAPANDAGPTDALWDYEVVELFLVGQNGNFLELELGPHGHHLVLYLDRPRTVSKSKIPIDYMTTIQGSRWSGQARVSRAYLPKQLVRFNAFAIHGTDSNRRYLAAHPMPGERPDFHQIDRFPELPLMKSKDSDLI